MKNSGEKYSALSFVGNDGFLKHQLAPTAESSDYWNQWLEHHPDAREGWEEARYLVEAVRTGLSDYARTYLSEEAEAYLLERILKTNAEASPDEEPVLTWWKNKWLVSAAAVLVIVAGFIFFIKNKQPQSLYTEQLVELGEKITEKVNDSSQPEFFQLPDGSAIILAPKSRLSYPADFNNETRTVYLSGEATFDIIKNPSKPFYVYANELVTKVLGTRFHVKAFGDEKDVEVTVQQGKVSVYRNEKNDNQDLEGVLLLPNQKVTFERITEQFRKTIIPEPLMVEKNEKIAPAISFVFDETPVTEVFERIKQAYEIDIVYDKDVLVNCQLTAILTEEPLFQKLDVITQSIEARYEMVEGKVVISAKGCQ
ncbi:DUF4974 domain-containing protein [Emticicia sp. CRIBPO]|uniref:FecR family protein n=1 Tax=Emticicia sp. CRIBPO TaxID=2683258 RepID=UPI0014134969|nr:FecR family protein [Emticicia sp. CRIBPO]NBA86823.1 DUF4974 domain-containing protein [Emticicia sp. CRIBPO]